MINMSEIFYSRAIENSLLKHNNKIKLLLGPRQSGKSTLLNHYIPDTEDTLIINLQDRRLRRLYEKDEGLLIRQLEGNKQIKTIYIDEIQKVPQLLDDLQYIYDKYKKYRMFVTGSSARQLKNRSSNLLPGRVHNLLLSPVLQAEQRNTILLPCAMKDGHKFPQRDLENYLLFGNLPGLFHEDVESWENTLEAYAELYIENEIRQENIVRDMGAFLRFLKIAALESGQLINTTKLAKSVGVAVNTVRNFYQVLEDTYVGIKILPFGRSKKRIISAPRFLIFDIGLRHILAELPVNKSLIQLDAGHIFEQWIMIELFYRCKLLGRGYSISTWRTKTGAEVDVIIETPEEYIPVEIKYTKSPTRSHARHIETFIHLHSDMCHKGYVVCRTPIKQQLTSKVTALPWNEF
ncbi:MAG: ATPase [Candidatus Magnetoglobus multicellularis str. Araruama]|uniref:ATPase n=1 Tax=Candidatus Magnetoglobus multicellularis str. Araruama TaxID=890399 RepID=A0A1V1P014_9BACT|nr:MAG: ATPase [Candidatus Magnetoglobus multicellularis str. Araruama]